MDIKKRAAEYFKSHPKTSVFYLTSDGMAFFNKSDAEAHARDLKDEKVFTERHPSQESPVQKIVDDIKARIEDPGTEDDSESSGDAEGGEDPADSETDKGDTGDKSDKQEEEAPKGRKAPASKSGAKAKATK